MGSKGAPLGCDLRGAGPANEGVGEVAERGHDLGGSARAQAGVILAEGDVAYPVPALDTPMTADEGQQPGGVGPPRREAGDEVDDLRMQPRAIAHGPQETDH